MDEEVGEADGTSPQAAELLLVAHVAVLGGPLGDHILEGLLQVALRVVWAEGEEGEKFFVVYLDDYNFYYICFVSLPARVEGKKGRKRMARVVRRGVSISHSIGQLPQQSILFMRF